MSSRIASPHDRAHANSNSSSIAAHHRRPLKVLAALYRSVCCLCTHTITITDSLVAVYLSIAGFVYFTIESLIAVYRVPPRLYNNMQLARGHSHALFVLIFWYISLPAAGTVAIDLYVRGAHDGVAGRLRQVGNGEQQEFTSSMQRGEAYGPPSPLGHRRH